MSKPEEANLACFWALPAQASFPADLCWAHSRSDAAPCTRKFVVQLTLDLSKAVCSESSQQPYNWSCLCLPAHPADWGPMFIGLQVLEG